MAKRQLRRGRKPSIAVAAGKLVDMRRMLKALVTETHRLQRRLNTLDSFYSKQPAVARTGGQSSTNGSSRRGPNVREAEHGRYGRQFSVGRCCKRRCQICFLGRRHLAWLNLPYFSSNSRNGARVPLCQGACAHGRSDRGSSMLAKWRNCS